MPSEAFFGRPRLEQVGAAQAGRQAFQFDRIPLGLPLLVGAAVCGVTLGNPLLVENPVGRVTFDCPLRDLGEALVCLGRVEPVNDEEPSSR